MITAKELLLVLGLGVSCGVFMAFVFIEPKQCKSCDSVADSNVETTEEPVLHTSEEPVLHTAEETKLHPTEESTLRPTEGSTLNHTAASVVRKKPRILCWVMTSPRTLYVKGKAVKETWGKRCDILLFMSSQADPSYPAIGLDVAEGRDHLWDKTREAWRYIFENHLYDADWFIKTDDDTYLIVENLRYLVRDLDTETAHYLGRKLFPHFNSGGAGYVFSRQALRIFAMLLDDSEKCEKKSLFEDVEVANCFMNAGVHAGDTRDKRGRERFHCYTPKHHLVPGFLPKDHWLRKESFYSYVDGPDCCSDRSVSFHYVEPDSMYLLDFLFYLRPRDED